MARHLAYRQWAVRSLLAVAVFVFWAWVYAPALAWQEQFQLFLFDADYLTERLAVPGGVAAYLAEFLTQFYNHLWMGAAVLAVLHVLLQLLTERLMRRENGGKPLSGILWGLSFLPSLALWFILGDESLMPAFTVSLLCVLMAMVSYPLERKKQLVYALCAVPVVYWVAGPLVWMLAVYVLIIGWRDSGSRWQGICLGMAMLMFGFVCVWLSALFEPYPLRCLLGSIFYYRFPEVAPLSVVALPALCLLVVGAVPPLERLATRAKNPRWVAVGVWGGLLAASIILIPQGYDKQKYELVEYDYLVRTGQWEEIVRKTEQHQPSLPMSVCAVNLALGMTNQLGDRAFEFFQHGAEGLLPKFVRDFNSTQLTGEAYFQLGLVNTAQRYAFEAMEAIPNYYKSGRAVKRLAEVNLINGQYRVAEKYLRMLEKTIFYRRWAQSRREMLADTTLIDRHPVYGRLRRLRLTDDFLFSEAELDKICGQLLMHNKENRLAMQYLVLYPLLERDLDKFMNYAAYANSLSGYNPTICQEGIAFACMAGNRGIPRGAVSAPVMNRFTHFGRTYTQGGKDAPGLEAFRNTVWYYLIKEQ
ncbi:MAG TPA: hypothetical protein H9824_02820 [Candidatus Bacteroides pullicola]|uniref:Transmembrane protein n=1 Tax=Candidatus Bacteroides pullicola TaxID=2838475 RepID=A0A9D2CJ87_9BACE|nr:hypothetical protein [Candidatus Bacteroides pullicola]